jgi:hypothetical protein
LAIPTVVQISLLLLLARYVGLESWVNNAADVLRNAFGRLPACIIEAIATPYMVQITKRATKA